MAALKRAYADIIFNTAKESAERILAAERKALGFQKSLFAAKEEALATMLRLKAVMEDKIREVEKASRTQEKKIEELELQLGEAEDTIVDLREELERVRAELTMMKDVSVRPLSDRDINEISIACNNIKKETNNDSVDETRNMSTVGDNMTALSQKIADTHQCRLQNVAITEFSKDLSIWSKVPELHRNGYMQRIHALEHNLTSKGPLGEINDLHFYSKCEPNTCTAENLEISFETDSLSSGKRVIQVKEALVFEEGCSKTLESGQVPGCDGEYHAKFFSKVSPQNQRAFYNQSNTFSDSVISGKHKPYPFSDGIFSDRYKSCASSSILEVLDEHNVTEAPKETHSSLIPVSTEIDEAIEEKSPGGVASTSIMNQCKVDTSIKKDSMGINHCTEIITWESVKKKQNQSEIEFVKNCLHTDDEKDPLLSRTVSKISSQHSTRVIQEDLTDRIEVAVATREEVENAAENLDNCITVKPDPEVIENGTAQMGTDKFLKYTFQRKRKRGCSPIKNEIVFPEKKPTLKPKPVDKQTSLPVPSNSSVVTDLPRNNRRVVQVARQLISLSEKRW